MLAEPDAAAPGRAGNAGIDQLDPLAFEGRNQLHQRIDVAADDAVAGLHALDRRHRQIRKLGHLPLIDVQERTRGPELIGGDHEGGFSGSGLDLSIINMNYRLKHRFRGAIYQRAAAGRVGVPHLT